MKLSSGEVGVAVKMLKTGACQEEKVKFLQEAAVNGQFHHPNIVKLLGVVTVGEPVSPRNVAIPSLAVITFIAHPQAMIVLELMKNGNLKNFLSSRKPGWVQIGEYCACKDFVTDVYCNLVHAGRMRKCRKVCPACSLISASKWLQG